MRTTLWAFAAVLLVIGNLQAQSGKTIHCFSAVQALVTNPSGVSPSTPKALLDAEIPQGTQFVSASYYARPRIAGTVTVWSTCPSSGNCQGVYFPALSSGTVAPDGQTTHYGAMVTSPANGSPSFNGDVYVRLIVEYSTTDSVCKSQNSFQVSAGWGIPGFGLIMLPPGKTPTLFLTFGAELVEGGKWLDCGSTPNPATTPQPQTCMVPNGNIGGLSFTLTPFTDEADGRYGVQDLCHNWSTGYRRGCRTVVEYQP